MKTYEISLMQIYNANELHALLMEVLPLPEYYGGTLDAFYDILTEQGEGWSLHFLDCDEAEACLGKYFRSFRKACLDAQQENPCLEVFFE